MDETSQQKTDHDASSPRSKSRKRDRSASEERLLKAAEEVFAKHGFKGSTTRMIAQKAKVNESLIGRYFDGKMGLLLAIIEKHIEELPVKELLYPPQATVREELFKLIDVMYNKHCHKDEEFFKIVLSQALTDPKFLKKVRDIIPEKAHPEVKARLEALKKQGKFRADVDVETFLITLDTYFHGAMLFERLLMGCEEGELTRMLHFVTDIYAKSVEV